MSRKVYFSEEFFWFILAMLVTWLGLIFMELLGGFLGLVFVNFARLVVQFIQFRAEEAKKVGEKT